MKRTDVPPFTLKLRRVMAGVSRLDTVEKLNKLAGQRYENLATKPNTFRGWLSQGNIPKNGQIALLAEILGCSVQYLCDDRIPVDADPRATVDLGTLKDEAILGELNKRLGLIARDLEELIGRAEGYAWEAVAAWLLRCFNPPQPESDFVLAGLQLFKDLEPKATRFRLISGEAAPSGGFITAWDGGMPDLIDAGSLMSRLDVLREEHPGILAISYYLHYFDEEWRVGMYGKKESKPTPDWDDRRAWLMAQLVTHTSLQDDPRYESIRERLREMNYIDSGGKPRDYGYSKLGLGDFDIPEPTWEN